jgi:hypothetical protein
MMTSDEKLTMVKNLLGDDAEAISDDNKIQAFLNAAAKEIIAWRYSYDGEFPKEVPEEYEMVQIFAVIAGYSQSGAEGQATHSEKGISRTFNYPDMLHYIHRNVVHKVGVL